MCYSAMIRRDLHSMDWKFGHHWVRESFPEYELRHSSDPKLFPKLGDRIFPGSYASVVHENFAGLLTVEPMRYSAYPPSFIPAQNKYTTFNARRDNLQSDFWSEAFRHHHGFIVLTEFFEWVAVADLLQAGVVTVDDVQKEFAKQAEERRSKVTAAGKVYRKTPTEAKDPRFRKIIISFQADQARPLLVPTIYSSRVLDDGSKDFGFAIVTDDPPPEILLAGHDRCPVFLEEDALAQWLHPKGKSAKELLEILQAKPPVTFNHRLPEAA